MSASESRPATPPSASESPPPPSAVSGELRGQESAGDADWGIRWPADPDAVEEHPTEESARRVAAVYSCAQLVRRTPSPWIPVPEEDTP